MLRTKKNTVLSSKGEAMNIIITAGGTVEKIDNVRKIQNTSTGKLGVELFNCLTDALEKGNKNYHIYYIAPVYAKLPLFHKKSSWIEVSDVQSVYEGMEMLLTTNKIDWVVHSMAISDFTVYNAYKTNDYLEYVVEATMKFLEQGKNKLETVKCIHEDFTKNQLKALNREGKIPSSDDIVLTMKKTPKIIQWIKKWQPNTKLVGFKLLNGVTEEELLSVAKALEINNRCEFVIANDYQKIDEHIHEAILIKNGEIVKRFYSKAAIANGIVKQIIDEWRENQ